MSNVRTYTTVTHEQKVQVGEGLWWLGVEVGQSGVASSVTAQVPVRLSRVDDTGDIASGRALMSAQEARAFAAAVVALADAIDPS